MRTGVCRSHTDTSRCVQNREPDGLRNADKNQITCFSGQFGCIGVPLVFRVPSCTFLYCTVVAELQPRKDPYIVVL